MSVSSIGTTWVQVIVEIENTGEAPIYLSSGSYDLKDASGSIIASKSYVSEYPRVVSIGEKAYLYDETTLDLPVTGTLTVVPRINEKKATIQNKQDHPIGILDDLISDDFPAGAEMGFEATSLSMPDEITKSSVARYETYAYPYQYQC